jgi:polyisoprenoid-binding protein YceI
MKTFWFIVAFFYLSLHAEAQLYIAKSGTISFFSEAPMENIEAESKSVNALLNAENNEIAVIVPIRSFQFKKALMQEHFNEKYLESDKYKEARFKGKISGAVDYKKDGIYPVTASGVLNVHGIEKNYTEKGTLTVKEGTLLLTCKFNVVLKDHKIEVPSIVAKKIAEQVAVTMDIICMPYKK